MIPRRVYDTMNAFSFGLFADCQYADKRAAGSRQYKKAARKLRGCVDRFNAEKLAFVVNLGDLIDGGFSSFAKVLGILSRLDAKIYHLAGNHDFAVADHEKGKVLETLGIASPYHSFIVNDWRFIIIDGTDISCYRYPSESPEHVAARDFHAQRAPGTAGWNGGIGKSQLDWLAGELAAAQLAEERVIILSHFPVYPDDPHNLWNAADLAFINDFACVKAFISGHNHRGSYVTRDRKHYIGLRAMVDTWCKTAFCIVDVSDDVIAVRAFGREKGRVLDVS